MISGTVSARLLHLVARFYFRKQLGLRGWAAAYLRTGGWVGWRTGAEAIGWRGGVSQALNQKNSWKLT